MTDTFTTEDLDVDEVPEELFTSVAEVLAYVYRVAGRRSRASRRAAIAR